MVRRLDNYSDTPDNVITRSQPVRKEKQNSDVTRVIRNREQAELLFIKELDSAKVEVLIASSSLSYLGRLDSLGFLDSIERAKSRGVEVLILCPKLHSNTTEQDANSGELLLNLKKYSQVRGASGQIKGSIILPDNSRVLSISEEGIDALTIYSDNKSLVNNFGSLFETLWVQEDIFRDLVRSKDSLLRSIEQLRQHDEMQKEFINIAAHELRTPVQPLLVIAELLHGDLESNKEDTNDNKNNKNNHDQVKIGRRNAEILIRNIKRLERLTTDILEVSRIESKSLVLKLEKLDLSKIVEEAIGDIKVLIAAEKVQIYYVRSKLQVIVSADASKIAQVITNLLRNAIKFTGKGRIEMNVTIEGKEALVTITDSGPGIDPLIMPRLFTKFSSMGQYGGTGLGLYISKAIVETHGGRIWAENNKDGKRGATFTFTLPLAES